MTTPVPDADAAEQRLPAGSTEPGTELPAVGDAVPVADAVEQALPAGPGPHGELPADVPLEVDPFDAAEQSAVVPLDEDEGRE